MLGIDTYAEIHARQRCHSHPLLDPLVHRAAARLDLRRQRRRRSPAGSPNFSTTVFVGDSLTAGFQNGSLLDTQQPNGWAPLVANAGEVQDHAAADCAPGSAGGAATGEPGAAPGGAASFGNDNRPRQSDEQPTDLAVPGHTLHDLLYYGPTLARARKT